MLSDPDEWRHFAGQASYHLVYVWLKSGIMELASTPGLRASALKQGKYVWVLSGLGYGQHLYAQQENQFKGYLRWRPGPPVAYYGSR